LNNQTVLSPQDIAALKKEILSSLHCALPGIVESFDPEAGTAVIRPAVKLHRSDQHVIPRFGTPGERASGSFSVENGQQPRVAEGEAGGSPRSSDVPLPLLRNVPVYLPEDREISPGEFALVIFADCDIDAWFETGEVSVPVSSRQHDLSDAFAFVGFRAGHQMSS